MKILFETERLICRWLVPDDLDVMYAVYSDADAMRWVDDGQPIERAACVEWVQVTLRNYETRGYGMSVLEDRETGSVAGFCGLVHPDGQSEAEIKYAFFRDWWGRGVATEAAIGMLDYGATELGLTFVIATAALANLASHRVLLKAGMRATDVRAEDDGSFTQLFEWNARSS